MILEVSVKIQQRNFHLVFNMKVILCAIKKLDYIELLPFQGHLTNLRLQGSDGKTYTLTQTILLKILALLIIREMQIKNTLKYHFTFVRLIIKLSTNDRCWRECGEKGTFVYCWWECKLVQTPWRTAWRFLQIF